MPSLSVSVIVPCYNTARYLGAALESICSQDRVPDEVIVVDDGSTDGSADIAESWGGPVRCVRQDHLGAAVARNTGLDTVRGDLVAFLDADDLWTGGSLSARVDALTADSDSGCAAGLTEQFISPDVSGDMRDRWHAPSEPSRGRVPGVLVVRRGVIGRIGGFDPALRLGDNIDWVARIDAAGIGTVMVERVVMRRRIHGGNIGVQHPEWRGDYLRMLKRALDRKRASTWE